MERVNSTCLTSTVNPGTYSNITSSSSRSTRKLGAQVISERAVHIMTIFTRYLTHRFVLCVLLSLFIFQFLPNATCQQQQEPESKVTAESVIGIVLLSFFLFSIIGCCFFYACQSAEIEAESRQVLHTRERHGLEKDIIESLPFFLYSEIKGLKIGKGGVECAICLNEFEDEETLRWMPPCSHTFHANCIDVWLSSRSTCPVCRANLSLKPGESFPYPSMDLETGNAQSSFQESPNDISLTCNNDANYIAPRSRSTGLLSSWRMAEIFVSRSHSTGRSVVQLGENLERFTLQLPDEVQRQLVGLINPIWRSHMALPQARSSRQGYRSGSVGSERTSFSQGRQTLRRAISMSLSFQAASVRSTLGKHVQETSQTKDKDSGERSFERLMPEKD
ncbi:putative RING-H2 finger protein ATL37 [Raphanus sativus]|nr:putative RING-H2 finger protein ATL37 [Raphanus sativus]